MTVTKIRRLVNPGKRRRNARKRLTPLQKLYFGSKRQRAAVSGRKVNKGLKHYPVKTNVGSILTVWPAELNPGRKRSRNRGSKRVVIINSGGSMARRRRKANPWPFKSHKRGRRKSVRVRVRRAASGVRRAAVRTYYKVGRPFGIRRHRVRAKVVRRGRRRNPGITGGTVGKVGGILAGVAVTSMVTKMLPIQFQTGIMGYLAMAVVAFGQGKLVGKVLKKPGLGTDMQIGGYACVVKKILDDYIPSIGSLIPGMGVIGASNFYVPQVNLPGSMGRFVLPNAIPGLPVNAGVGRLRRTGRLM